jgi:hypothetical protein
MPIVIPVADPELYAIEELIDPTNLPVAFPLEFVLDSAEFKQTISNAEKYSTTISFEKHPGYELCATYALINIIYHQFYDDPAKIRLVTHYDAKTRVFKCPITIGGIKPLASSIITDSVRIMCSDEQPLILLKSSMDDSGLDDNSLATVYTLAKTTD